MRVRIRYFAALREATGREADVLDVPDGATVAQAREQLATLWPAAAPLLPACAAALNRAYATDQTPLAADDELVFIPPLGGG